MVNLDKEVMKKPIPSLYSCCLNNIITNNYDIHHHESLDSLPDHIVCDIYYKMYLKNSFYWLSYELSEYNVISKVLRVKHTRSQFLKIFGDLKDFDPELDKFVVKQFEEAISNSKPDDYCVIENGLRIGAFFSELGWYPIAHEILNMTEKYCLTLERNVHILKKLLYLYHRRLFVESSYSLFTHAENTFQLANKVIQELEDLQTLPNLCGLYAIFAHLFVMRSEYNEAYKWAHKSITLLKSSMPTRMIIDVLRISSRACVFKRKFAHAALLIEQALCLAERKFKHDKNPILADILMDYGFYLLNTDRFEDSVKLYRKAVDIRLSMFGAKSLKVAFVKEDLAYAMYVHEYSSGDFTEAIKVITESIDVLTDLVPKNHLALASTHRVKALILEEMAIDMRHQANQETRDKFFITAETLHKEALDVSLEFFGKINVHTAKHYGNLGRLYQSMNRYEQAEKMHLQAIQIKEHLLGADDYEVGLSLGHLASLYNFHMRRYRDAEKLYLRSIDISLKLFGETYSCLEYDYRGLIKVYTELEDIVKLERFTDVIKDWKDRRKDMVVPKIPTTELSVQTIIQKFTAQC